MTFEEKLKNYAELLVTHGLNVQPGQILNINTEPYHTDLALLITRAAYAKGAKFVNCDLGDPRFLRERILSNSEEELQYVPAFLGVKYEELVDEHAANLKLLGPVDPDVLSDLDAKKVNLQRLHQHLAIKYFYDEGIGKSKVHWTVASASTPGWGKKVFPDLDEEAACQALWEQIFTICRVDTPDFLERWQTHNTALHKRASTLTEMQIDELHFTGPDTDLRVGLSNKAKWKGGTDTGPRGVEYEPNIPTEECFTTPDNRRTNGKVKATRPFLINGKMIRDLHVEFEEGVISNFSASNGEDTFREYINSDEGASRLGEVALVGVDSPIYQSGLVFEEILFDENAACHVAVGSAYKFCLDGGETMGKEELLAIGCNESSVHTDFMISSEEVDVTAKSRDGSEIALIKNGEWVEL